jgi:pseudouridine kinase
MGKGCAQASFLVYSTGMKRPVVIGGATVDLKGRPLSALKPHTSNIGVLEKSTGGVALNIALNLAALGAEPLFISLLGDDSEGDYVRDRCRRAGLDTGHIITLPGGRTAVYEAILDEHGELYAGISAMALFDRLTPDLLRIHEPLLREAPLVIIDANPPQETIAYLSSLAALDAIPLWMEPTSFDKCRKISGHLAGVSYISPNREELEALAGRSLETEADVSAAARQIVGSGVREVFVTLGREGVLHLNGHSAKVLKTPVLEALDVTGAGDAFVAGTSYGILRSLALPDALRCGMAAAFLTVQESESVSPAMSAALLERTTRIHFPTYTQEHK